MEPFVKTVFELPMRDGNTPNRERWSLLSKVFELPMRDGNLVFKWLGLPATKGF